MRVLGPLRVDRTGRNHPPDCKAKVAFGVVKGDRTIAQ